MRTDDAALTQFAALPFRERKGRLEVLLATSRDTGRWVLPKGWPMKGKKPHEAAAQEALEEAGLKGKAGKKPLGSYVYWKRMKEHFVLVRVQVFPLRVTKQLKVFREAAVRRLAWMTPHEAALLVDEAGLSNLMLAFVDAQGESGLGHSREIAAPS
ncbi:NUDIX hydrolase [Alsobacter metallidurans]|uniref:NUDIX hydrolase n=1 Tax=Alsobacter metallidurans TaxID=340221 RepID=A0A917I613_9HYPH|nr:NUDIX hydrolase [Alsobacter metallidurans]GGH13399.1 NUDIX hydrolase [Alsobacter metallidurans]